jgi:hypothetical protein
MAGRVKDALSATGVEGALDTITASAITTIMPPICNAPTNLPRMPSVDFAATTDGWLGLLVELAKGLSGLRFEASS